MIKKTFGILFTGLIAFAVDVAPPADQIASAILRVPSGQAIAFPVDRSNEMPNQRRQRGSVHPQGAVCVTLASVPLRRRLNCSFHSLATA